MLHSSKYNVERFDDLQTLAENIVSILPAARITIMAYGKIPKVQIHSLLLTINKPTVAFTLHTLSVVSLGVAVQNTPSVPFCYFYITTCQFLYR